MARPFIFGLAGASLPGVFVAGYVGLYEILLESLLISWASFYVFYIPENAEDETALNWIRNLKKRLIQTAIDHGTIAAASKVAMFGVLFGWALAACWLFVREPRFVLAREIKETLLDAVVVIPFIIMLSVSMRVTQEVAQDCAEKTDEGGQPSGDPRGPEAYDFLERYGAIQKDLASQRAGVTLGHAAWLLINGIATIAVVAAYAAGEITRRTWPLDMLDRIRDWQL